MSVAQNTGSGGLDLTVTARDLLVHVLANGDRTGYKTDFGVSLRAAALFIETAEFLKSEEKAHGAAITLLLERIIPADSWILATSTWRSAGTSLVNVRNHVRSLLDEAENAPRPWVELSVSKETRDIPTMLFPETMQYYKWLSSQCYKEGHVVELGAWLGSSTRCLSEGPSVPPSRYRLHVYDSFVWERWMNRFLDLISDSHPPKPGDSFIKLFETNVQEYQDRIVLHPGYLEEGSDCPGKPLLWDCDEPIELLVYDMGPMPDLLNSMWRQFSPFFKKHRTLIVFNEYGKMNSSLIWEFCRQHSDHLIPHHKPQTSAKGFLYV